MKQNADPLIREIIKLSASLSTLTVLSLCEALEALARNASTEEKLLIANLAPNPSTRDSVKKLLMVWVENHSDLDGPSLALAFRAATLMDQHHRDSQSLELVWTGPAPTTSYRRTDQALLELVNSAEKSILIVTYAAYRMPELEEALVSSGRRKVQITMVVESSQASDGKIEFGALESFGPELLELATIYVWPLENRERDSKGNYGSLHVKCAVADEQLALISSANLTGFAMTLNMELGVLIRGGAIPVRMVNHVNDLIENKTLMLLRRC